MDDRRGRHAPCRRGVGHHHAALAASSLGVPVRGGGMWVVSAVAVAVLNLDAAVVLCTPLAAKVARRSGVDPVAMAFQPALLACLASSALPVSNLTNLIAVADGRISPADLSLALALPTLVACAVGYAGWRLAFRRRGLVPTAEPRSARSNVAHSSSAPPYSACSRRGVRGRAARRRVEIGPVGTAGVAAGLAIVSTAAAVRTGLAHVLVAPGIVQQALLGAGAANVLNNLPAFLLAAPHTTNTDQVLALLLGVNLGPTVLVTGSLAGLLWLESARRCGLDVGARQYARVGLIAGIPAFVAAIAVLTLTT